MLSRASDGVALPWGCVYGELRAVSVSRGEADVRCRKELMGKIRLRCIQQKEMGGSPAGYDDDRPWDYDWKAAVEDQAFWQEQ
eukprot:6413725-Amphidinium_carterae.1